MSFKLTDWSMRNLRLQVWVLFKANNFLARQASQMRKSFAGTTLMSFSDSNESASLTHTHCSNSPLQYSRLEEAYWNEWPLGFDWNTWEYNLATWFTCTCMYQLVCALCIFCLWSKTTVVSLRPSVTDVLTVFATHAGNSSTESWVSHYRSSSLILCEGCTESLQ